MKSWISSKFMRKNLKDLHFVDLSVVMHLSKSENLNSKNYYFSLKIFYTFKINADMQDKHYYVLLIDQKM